jgi:GDP-L-fucose synthase
VVFLMQRYSAQPHVNIGCGSDVTINEFAALFADVVDFRGGFHDLDRPHGAPQKLLDLGRINALGWAAPTPPRDGLTRTCWYRENVASFAMA